MKEYAVMTDDLFFEYLSRETLEKIITCPSPSRVEQLAKVLHSMYLKSQNAEEGTLSSVTVPRKSA